MHRSMEPQKKKVLMKVSQYTVKITSIYIALWYIPKPLIAQEHSVSLPKIKIVEFVGDGLKEMVITNSFSFPHVILFKNKSDTAHKSCPSPVFKH